MSKTAAPMNIAIAALPGFIRLKNDASLAVWNMDEHYVIPTSDPTGRSVI